VTRLDRIEPDLNEAKPGDLRDTTTPAAMTSNLKNLLLGDVLSVTSREQLSNWMLGSTTGNSCLRAGFLKDWRIGDKTGSGGNGTRNDVAVIWPPQRGPVFVSAYLTGATTVTDDQRNAAIASVGRAITTVLG
jgi:beta-lactamase class A